MKFFLLNIIMSGLRIKHGSPRSSVIGHRSSKKLPSTVNHQPPTDLNRAAFYKAMEWKVKPWLMHRFLN